MYIYIGGRGGSGSTILDILIGNSAEVESVGELLSGLRRADTEVCSCGAKVVDCPFWRSVDVRMGRDGFTLADAREASHSWGMGFWLALLRRTAPRHVQITRSVYQAVTGAAGKPHMLDSSKSPAHALLLLRHMPDARVIHLVRDPRAVIRSVLRKVRRDGGALMRRYPVAGRNTWLFVLSQGAGWMASSIIYGMLALVYPNRVVKVRFEDLCTDPSGELARIGTAFGLDLADPVFKAQNGSELEVGHNIGGNRIRHTKVRFNRSGEATVSDQRRHGTGWTITRTPWFERQGEGR